MTDQERRFYESFIDKCDQTLTAATLRDRDHNEVVYMLTLRALEAFRAVTENK